MEYRTEIALQLTNQFSEPWAKVVNDLDQESVLLLPDQLKKKLNIGLTSPRQHALNERKNRMNNLNLEQIAPQKPRNSRNSTPLSLNSPKKSNDEAVERLLNYAASMRMLAETPKHQKKIKSSTPIATPIATPKKNPFQFGYQGKDDNDTEQEKDEYGFLQKKRQIMNSIQEPQGVSGLTAEMNGLIETYMEKVARKEAEDKPKKKVDEEENRGKERNSDQIVETIFEELQSTLKTKKIEMQNAWKPDSPQGAISTTHRSLSAIHSGRKTHPSVPDQSFQRTGSKTPFSRAQNGYIQAATPTRNVFSSASSARPPSGQKGKVSKLDELQRKLLELEEKEKEEQDFKNATLNQKVLMKRIGTASPLKSRLNLNLSFKKFDKTGISENGFDTNRQDQGDLKGRKTPRTLLDEKIEELKVNPIKRKEFDDRIKIYKEEDKTTRSIAFDAIKMEVDKVTAGEYRPTSKKESQRNKLMEAERKRMGTRERRRMGLESDFAKGIEKLKETEKRIEVALSTRQTFFEQIKHERLEKMWIGSIKMLEFMSLMEFVIQRNRHFLAKKKEEDEKKKIIEKEKEASISRVSNLLRHVLTKIILVARKIKKRRAVGMIQQFAKSLEIKESTANVANRKLQNAFKSFLTKIKTIQRVVRKFLQKRKVQMKYLQIFFVFVQKKVEKKQKDSDAEELRIKVKSKIEELRQIAYDDVEEVISDPNSNPMRKSSKSATPSLSTKAVFDYKKKLQLAIQTIMNNNKLKGTSRAEYELTIEKISAISSSRPETPAQSRPGSSKFSQRPHSSSSSHNSKLPHSNHGGVSLAQLKKCGTLLDIFLPSREFICDPKIRFILLRDKLFERSRDYVWSYFKEKERIEKEKREMNKQILEMKDTGKEGGGGGDADSDTMTSQSQSRRISEVNFGPRIMQNKKGKGIIGYFEFAPATKMMEEWVKEGLEMTQKAIFQSVREKSAKGKSNKHSGDG